MADFNQAVKWMKEGKKVLVNGKETFSGTGDEFIKANFEILEDSWNFKDYIDSPDEFGLYEVSAGEIETLKQKIFEDIKTKKNKENFIHDYDMYTILDKRFGF